MGCLQAEGAACGRELVFKGRHAAGEGSAGGMAAFVGRSESSTPIWQRPKGASPISRERGRFEFGVTLRAPFCGPSSRSALRIGRQRPGGGIGPLASGTKGLSLRPTSPAP